MITEVMGKKFRGVTTSLGFFLYGVGAFALLGMNLFVSDYTTNILVIELSLVVCIVFFYLMGETPFYYYKRKNITMIYKTMSKIADTNYEPIKSKQVKNQILKSFDVTDEDMKDYDLIKIKKITGQLSYWTRVR